MDLQPFQTGRLAAEEALSRSQSYPAKSFAAISSQSLASILNNPHGGKSGVYSSDAYWTGWWGSSSAAVSPPEFAPLVLAKPLPEVSRSDFAHYLGSISEPHCRFEDVRNHSSKEGLSSGRVGSAGEALLACLLEVPVLYFKEDFALEYGATFREACPFSTIPENILLQEKLSQYLDVVEVHLVKEISLRSDSFFEAQGRLQDLNVKIVEGCSRIRKLKETIRLLDADLVESASEIQGLYGTRSNLISLQQKLRLILYVNQAISALKLLVTSGDCAGALDVTDGLKHLLGGDELAGLHCFLHLRDHVVDAIDSVNSILSGDFMRAALSDARENDVIVLSRANSTTFALSKVEEDAFGMEDISGFRDRFLPIVIGLLRTTKLPSVLRAYRETLTSDMKAAIKTSVAKLLPVLVVRPTHTDYTSGERSTETDSGGLSLASKLRSLSCDNFVELLDVIFKIVQVHLVRASEVKKTIEWIMLKCNGNYATDSLYSTIILGTTYGAIEDKSHQIGASPKKFSRSSPDKIQSFKDKSNDISSPSNISKNLRADILRENTEALFAACDVAHGRWAKLLGVRAILHPKLRLPEFLSVYGITKEFVTTTEKIGGRLGYSIRGSLQSQAKAFIDFQHDSKMAKMKAVLDQETWVEVDVPDEFQAIATSVFCSESEHERLNRNEFNPSINSSEVASINGDIPTAGASGTKSPEIVQQINPELSESTDSGILNSSSQNHSNNMKERKSSQTLCYKDADYHMVNCGLILLKILSEYINLNDSLPILSSEVVHRVVEVLKFFNTRTCQLVLGAGAMKVAGLKSITSKHLALASQVISFIYSIIPEFRQILFLNVPEARKVLLMSEFDRVAQDYRIHRDEIHTKLVQIMRERLLFHLRGLPQIVENWNRSEDGDDVQPSQFAKSLTKEVGFLHRVLSRTLHPSDVRSIFRNVVMIFHLKISEAFLQLETSNPNVKRRLYGETQHILGCIRTLPSDEYSDSGIQNWGKLDEFMEQTYGTAGSQ